MKNLKHLKFRNVPNKFLKQFSSHPNVEETLKCFTRLLNYAVPALSQAFYTGASAHIFSILHCLRSLLNMQAMDAITGGWVWIQKYLGQQREHLFLKKYKVVVFARPKEVFYTWSFHWGKMLHNFSFILETAKCTYLAFPLQHQEIGYFAKR